MDPFCSIYNYKLFQLEVGINLFGLDAGEMRHPRLDSCGKPVTSRCFQHQLDATGFLTPVISCYALLLLCKH